MNLVLNMPISSLLTGGCRSLIRCGQIWLQKRTVYSHSGLAFCSRCWTVRTQSPRLRASPHQTQRFLLSSKTKRTRQVPTWRTSSKTRNQNVSLSFFYIICLLEKVDLLIRLLVYRLSPGPRETKYGFDSAHIGCRMDGDWKASCTQSKHSLIHTPLICSSL